MKKLLFVSLLLSSVSLFSQLSVQSGFTATQLGNTLAGSNITINNATINGSPAAFGTFQFNGSGFPLSSGVILSTGNITDAIGPNNNTASGNDLGQPGNTLLTSVAGVQTFDAVEFTFDFEVQSSKIEFNYIFASEEYNEFVGSGFNDVFAFYISGPGITGWKNIALVPNTNVPVAINNINNGSFWQYYNDNNLGGTNIQYDGYTDVLTAKEDSLQVCGVYTLKLVIADAGDGILDAAVFLQENSLVQETVSAQTNTINANGIALEGCIQASFTFNLDSAYSTSTTIPYQIAGSATNGVDYAHLDTFLVIPAGQTSATIILDAFADGIPEGQEYVDLIFTPQVCQPNDTVRLIIDDNQPIQFSLSGSDLGCFEDNSGIVNMSISGGFPPYTITLTDTLTGAQGTYSSLPITGLNATTYLVEISDSYGCEAEAVVIGGNFNAGQTYLPDGTGVSYTSSLNISGFNVGQTLTNVNQINSICASIEHSYANDLTIVLQAPNGAQVTLKNVGPTGGAINAVNMGEPVASGPVDSWNASNITPGVGYNYCWTNTPTFPTMNAYVAAGVIPQYTYVSTFGNTLTDYYLPPGSYAPVQSLAGFIGTPLNGTWTLIVTDNYALDNGYIFNWTISLSSDLPDSTITLSQPDSITVSGAITSPACGASTGAINITATGDFPPFTYSWSNGANTEDVSGLAAGSYTVTVTDANSCSQQETFIVPNITAATISGVVTNSSCNGSNNGSIDVSVSGTSPFTYSWTGGATTQDLTNLSPGTYTVTVTDGGGCIGLQTFTVSQPLPLSISNQITNESCGDMSGIVNITPIGGTGPYTFNWSNGSTLEDIDELSQGTYSVTVTDVNGCNVNGNFTVINLVGNCAPVCDLAINSQTQNNETCGQANGSLSVNVFTTNAPYSVSWSNGSTNSTISNLSAGTYTVNITDAEGCLITNTYIISNQTGTLAITSNSISNEACGNNQGAINITVSGGALPYSFNWSNGATTEDLNLLTAGSYSVTLTDGSGCSLNANYTVQNLAGTLNQTYGNAFDANCGQSNGSIDITIAGGQTPYTYLWTNSATTQDLPAVPAGSYQCTITDASGCQISTPIYVVANLSGTLAFTLIDVDNEVCGNHLGECEVIVSGGSTPYSYLWNTGATTSLIGGLSAGTYSCQVTDAAGCSLTTGNLSLINDPGTLNVTSVLSTDEICGNNLGSVNLSVSGGSNPVTYLWSNGSNNQDLINIGAGSYTCTITDAAGCTTTANAFVNNDPGNLQIVNMVVSNETCGNGTGAVNLIISGASNPVTYSWSNGSITQDLSNINAGSYSVTVTDNNGCIASSNATVINNAGTLSASLSSQTNEICGNASGSLSINVSGGTAPYSYLWSNGVLTPSVNGLVAGNYTCTVTDNAGCVVVLGPFTILNSPGSLTVSSTLLQDEICNNNQGQITLSVSGGATPYTYVWSNGATTAGVNNLNSGTYTVTVTDANTCSVVQTYTIGNGPGTLGISNAVVSDEVCNNNSGSVNITINGGTSPYTYAWSNGATTQDISALNNGTYSVTVTDANGCQVSGSNYQVNNNPGNLALLSVNVTDAVCGNSAGGVNISIGGGQVPISYSWSNGATTQDITNVAANTYSCTISDGAGCSLVLSSIVSNSPGNLLIDNVNITDATCGQSNAAIDVSITGGTSPYVYTWSNGSTSQDLTNVPQGNYTLSVTDAGGCLVSQQFTASNSGGQPSISSITITNEVCGDGQGGLGVSVSGGTGPYTYSWTGPNCCSYTLNMFDSFGDGWNGASIDVSVNGILFNTYTLSNGNSGNAQIPICNGDAISLIYSPGVFEGEVTYNLQNSSGTIVHSAGPNPPTGNVYSGVASCSGFGNTSNLTGLSSSTYSVTVTDANGCSVNGSATVGNSSGSISISSSNVTDENCGGANGAIDITVGGAIPPITYLWSNGSTTQDITNISAGSYTVTVTASNACPYSQVFVVANLTNGLNVTNANITDDNCGGNTGAIDVTLTGGTSPYTFLWSNGALTEDISSIGSGNYTLTVTDASSCSFSVNYQVNNITNGLSSSTLVTDETCLNANGAIDLTLTGGVSPYSVSWNSGQLTEDLSGLTAGWYVYTITDASGCISIDSAQVIYQNNAPSISTFAITNEFCGGMNGGVNITVGGGSLPYTYLWSNGATSQDITNVAAGNYSVTITGSDGCSTTGTYTVNSTAFFNVNNVVITDASCSTCATGSVNITVGGGGGPYTYNWSNGAITQDIFNVLPGTYTVVITNNNGTCSLTQVYTVGVNGSTSVQDAIIEMQINIYPNPTEGMFTAEIDLNRNTDLTIQLTNILGEEIEARTIESFNTGKLSFDLTEKDNGVYFLRFKVEGQYKVLRILLSK